MDAIHTAIEAHVWVAWLMLAVSFAVLAKCADLFVDAAVALARRLKIPRLVIGIVLVSLATTAPELSVSVVAALRHRPEMALGNAVGSVICNSGLALALCGIFSPRPIVVIPHILRSSGVFLAGIGLAAFGMVAFDRSLGRTEGIVLVVLFIGYIAYLYRQHSRGQFEEHVAEELEDESHLDMPMWRTVLLFALSLGGILLASEFIVSSATTIAHWMHVPDAVIALTMVALGTSVPEVATCVTAARKGHGDLAVGNILGADIMNICWVAGASAVMNDLSLSTREIYFMFPAMSLMVTATLVVLATHWRLTRREGFSLLVLYVIYLASFVLVFRPTG